MKLTFRRSADETRGWPAYILGGRVRSSTAGLILAFVALFWVNQNYQPETAGTPQDQTQQVVPPGFVPDPNYTWVPRTNVRSREPEFTTTTTTTSTPTTSPTEPTTSPGGTTTPTGPAGPTTTVIDPDGPLPLSPQTYTQAPPPTSAPATTSAVPVPPTTASTR